MKTTRPFLITIALLSLTMGLIWWSGQRSPESLAMGLETIDPTIAGWTMVQSGSFSDRVLDRLRPTAYLSRTYRKDGKDLDLLIAYYAQQRAGESMHSPKHCLPGSGWEFEQRQSTRMEFRGRQVAVNQLVIQNGGQRLLVYYWYQSRQRIIASEYLGKVLLARDAIFSSGTAGSLVRITLPDTPEAASDGVAFAREVMRRLQKCLGA